VTGAGATASLGDPHAELTVKHAIANQRSVLTREALQQARTHATPLRLRMDILRPEP
jgi:hypothetical protein